MIDLVEGQFQFSTRSHQKEGSFQVFCIQVTPEAFCSRSFSFRIHPESEMEISITSDVTHQPSSTSPKRRQPPVATITSSTDLVLVQQMRSMISTFLGARQDPTPSPRQLFCNYLHYEIGHKKNNARERSPQVKRPPHFNFQMQHRPQQDHILTIQETQTVSIPVVQPTQTSTGEPVTVIAKVQQPPTPSSSSPSTQPATSYIVDDQHLGTSRQMIYKPPSVAPSQQEESQHNTSGLSSLFAAIPSILQYQQIDTAQPFSPSQLQPARSSVPSTTHQEQSRPPSQSSRQSQS